MKLKFEKILESKKKNLTFQFLLYHFFLIFYFFLFFGIFEIEFHFFNLYFYFKKLKIMTDEYMNTYCTLVK